MVQKPSGDVIAFYIRRIKMVQQQKQSILRRTCSAGLTMATYPPRLSGKVDLKTYTVDMQVVQVVVMYEGNA